MSIYTKTGDRGTTALFGGKRVLKSDLQIEAYGGVDELSSFIGFVISKLKDKPDRIFLTKVQKSLYQMMGVLCGATADLSEAEKEIKDFEQYIDKIQSKLPKLTRFILPQGTEISALFHILRVTCRKAERNIVKFSEQSVVPTSPRLRGASKDQLAIIKYINRLSDLFFMMARKYNTQKEVVT